MSDGVGGGIVGGTRWASAMTLALEQARRAVAWGDVPVGAVVLGPDDSVLAGSDLTADLLAVAGNERELTGDPSAHAEVLALRRAAAILGGWNLSGCTLVVTLEPCTMCAGALVAARISRLVFGAFDVKAGAVSSLWDVVRDVRLPHRVDVVSGIMAADCAEVLSDFFDERR